MNRLENLPTELQIKIWRIFWGVVWGEVVEQLKTVSVFYGIVWSDDTPLLYPTRICWCNGKDRGWGALYPKGADKNWWKTSH